MYITKIFSVYIDSILLSIDSLPLRFFLQNFNSSHFPILYSVIYLAWTQQLLKVWTIWLFSPCVRIASYSTEIPPGVVVACVFNRFILLNIWVVHAVVLQCCWSARSARVHIGTSSSCTTNYLRYEKTYMNEFKMIQS